MATEQGWRARSNAPETTEAFGERLGRALVPGALVALIGELGTGKTTLTRGLARGLGVHEAVVSPTFTRMRVLPGRLTLYHFDAWRGGAGALYEEAADFLAGEGVAVVEWADRVEEPLPRPRIEIVLRHGGASEREFHARTLAPPSDAGPRARALATALAAALAEARATAGLALLTAP
jgi:tRNA threonylcarbamoyladenosine biosynthesis protein TsaE